MNVIKSFLNSEKAIFVGLLIIAATILTIIGKMTVDAWISYTEVMAVTYVGGKSIQGAAAAYSKSSPAVALETVTAFKDAIAENDAKADRAVGGL